MRSGDNWQVVELDIAFSIGRMMIIAKGGGFVDEFRIKNCKNWLACEVISC